MEAGGRGAAVLTAGTVFPTTDTSDPDVDLRGTRMVTVHSPSLGRRADVTVWAPSVGTAPLPLVLLLHGVYGSHWGWVAKGRAHLTAGRLITAGAIPPVALAMPSDGLYGHGSGYVRHDDADYETWIVDEVAHAAHAVDERIDPGAPGAVIGLSMGGYGALRLAARHPQRFPAAAGMSSITRWQTMATFVGDLSGYPTPDDPDVGPLLIASEDRPAIRLDCGTDDLLIAENRALHDELDAAGVPHDYVEYPGGHEWAYWAAHLDDALRFVTEHLEGQ